MAGVITPGLVSVTFRALPADRTVALAADVGLQAIEWGGDVHVPHGDLGRAAEVRELTVAAGLSVAAYGSYYRVAESEAEGLAFGAVLDTALALGAPTVRVWPGRRGSAEADAGYRGAVIDDSRRIGELAAGAGVTVSYEFHAGTLTDTAGSASDLLDAVAHPVVRTLWQPPNDADEDSAADGLRRVLGQVTNVHVFHWWPDRRRRPLAEGAARWRRYLSMLRSTGRDHHALLEFVRDDEPAALAEDADTLRRLIAAA